MADPAGVSYTGARPGDALSSFLNRTVRSVYAPASAFRLPLQPAAGVLLQDAGARGFLSAKGAPTVSPAGSMAIDWRVVTAANVGATLGDAAAILAANAATVGAKLVSMSVSDAVGIAQSEAQRLAAAAGAAGSVPTIGKTIAKGAGVVGDVFKGASVYLIVILLIILAGLLVWTLR